MVERLGVSVAAVVNATNIISPAVQPSQRFTIARDLRNAVKARYESERWLHVAQPIFDKLRQKRRDALAAYIMDLESFDRIEQLFEYFLIDAGMEAVVQTSRLRLAISSVQLFVQRCLLNLEPKVRPSAINSGQWQWMKRYRVWEANRKIFLYPENFLEPEFRDDKTHLFQEMESALLQGDVSNDLAEDAFCTYLKGLEEIARLEIVTVYVEEKPDPASNVTHVLGRTYGKPHKYFYQRRAHRMWSAWEPVNVDIDGDHIALVVWRDRLHLFWVTFLDKPDASPGSVLIRDMGNKTASDIKPPHLIDVQLSWSDYFQGQWAPSQTSGFRESRGLVPVTEFDSQRVSFYIYKESEAGEEGALRILLNLSVAFACILRVENKGALSGIRNSMKDINSIHRVYYGAQGLSPFSYEGPLRVMSRDVVTAGNGKVLSETTRVQDIVKQVGEFRLDHSLNLVLIPPFDLQTSEGIDQARQWAWRIGEPKQWAAPFFYQDGQHTFYIEPTLTETITPWTETQFPAAARLGVAADSDGQLEQIAVEAHVPAISSALPPDLHALARFKLLPRQDWLTETGNMVRFDGQPVGESGGLDPLSQAARVSLDNLASLLPTSTRSSARRG